MTGGNTTEVSIHAFADIALKVALKRKLNLHLHGTIMQ